MLVYFYIKNNVIVIQKIDLYESTIGQMYSYQYKFCYH